MLHCHEQFNKCTFLRFYPIAIALIYHKINLTDAHSNLRSDLVIVSMVPSDIKITRHMLLQAGHQKTYAQEDKDTIHVKQSAGVVCCCQIKASSVLNVYLPLAVIFDR